MAEEELPTSIPESLCGNPDALVTPRGLTKKKPCGFWEAEGLGWCNSKDYTDWIAAYKLRLDRGISQYKDLVKWRDKKLTALTEEEKAFGMLLDDHKLQYKALQEHSYKTDDLTSQQYAKRISDIIVQAEELNCLIEEIQQAIINADGKIKPTGIIEGSRQESKTFKYAGYGAAALVGLIIYKKLTG